ncbi:hypothetical protein FRC20_002101 [Serendipita sp. 405]|nr:hypothetical protein FRC20_002101 [Serendipita sp. 405]
MDTLKDQATDSSASSGSGSLEYTFTDYLEESGLLKDLTVQQINAASDALVKRATGKPTKSAALVAVHIDTVMRNKGMTVVEENNRIRYVTLCQIMTEGGQFKTFTVNKPPSLDAYFRIPNMPRLGTTIASAQSATATNKDHGEFYPHVVKISSLII